MVHLSKRYKVSKNFFNIYFWIAIAIVPPFLVNAKFVARALDVPSPLSSVFVGYFV